jgi:hypothetical protein
MFKDETEEMLEWAFCEYLKTAKFFPRPSDIRGLIVAKSASAAAQAREYKPINRTDVEREQDTPEWEAASAAARAVLAKIAGKTSVQ